VDPAWSAGVDVEYGPAVVAAVVAAGVPIPDTTLAVLTGVAVLAGGAVLTGVAVLAGGGAALPSTNSLVFGS
jgi:hypothetical protein